jgi:hypothetical protein
VVVVPRPSVSTSSEDPSELVVVVLSSSVTEVEVVPSAFVFSEVVLPSESVVEEEEDPSVFLVVVLPSESVTEVEVVVPDESLTSVVVFPSVSVYVSEVFPSA